MWLSDESVCEVRKSPDHVGWARVFYVHEGITHNDEVVRRLAIVISAPSGKQYTFEPAEGERFSEFIPVHTKEDATFFKNTSPFEYRGKR